MRTYRILHIFGKMDRGGAEMRTLDLMEKLSNEKQFLFDFCVLSGQSGELDAHIRSLGGEVHYLKLNFAFANQFRRLLRTNKYDVIHSHVHLFSGYLLKLAAQEKIAVRICHLHTTGQLNGFSIRKMIQNRVMIFWLKKYSTNLLAVSVGAQEAFLRQAPIFENDLRLKLLYDAVNPEHFENLETFSVTDLNLSTAKPANPLIVHVGRTDPVKNHSRLFEIFHLISAKKPSAQLFLVGKTDHSRKKELTEKIKNLGLEDKVHFLGTRSDVLKILAGAKLMIFPSLWEGLPGAVLEAACLGIPVLSSDLPGSRELAKYFPQIEILSLDQTNDVWKEQAIKILDTGKQDQIRSLQILKASPFNIDLCLKVLKNIWSQSIQ